MKLKGEIYDCTSEIMNAFMRWGIIILVCEERFEPLKVLGGSQIVDDEVADREEETCDCWVHQVFP